MPTAATLLLLIDGVVVVLVDETTANSLLLEAGMFRIILPTAHQHFARAEVWQAGS
jgi:hypothetical protein